MHPPLLLQPLTAAVPTETTTDDHHVAETPPSPTQIRTRSKEMIPTLELCSGCDTKNSSTRLCTTKKFLEKISTYVISNYKDEGDLKPLIRRMVDPTDNFRKKKKLSTPSEDAATVDWDIYREEVKEYVGRESSLRRNIEKTFGLLWGQCSSSLQYSINGHSFFEDSYDDLDTVYLNK